jgi:hypothetical protein
MISCNKTTIEILGRNALRHLQDNVAPEIRIPLEACKLKKQLSTQNFGQTIEMVLRQLLVPPASKDPVDLRLGDLMQDSCLPVKAEPSAILPGSLPINATAKKHKIVTLRQKRNPLHVMQSAS